MTSATGKSLVFSGDANDARHGVQALATLEEHSKSFALAGRLLPRDVRTDAAVLYAWCRRADDAVDLVPAGEQRDRLERLLVELDWVYAESRTGRAAEPASGSAESALWAFRELVKAHGIPSEYPRELLAGMRMDVEGTRYDTIDDLLLYCHRVAGVVGLMMCHVLGVADARALRNAAHLGIGMQLSNICRDLLEDWGRGRLYLPGEWLEQAGASGLVARVGGDFPGEARRPVAEVVRRLLELAERFYQSGDRGLMALDLRSAYAIRTARLVYSAIGERIARAGFDPLAGRAVVPTWRKLLLASRALFDVARQLPARSGSSFQRVELSTIVRYSDVVVRI